MDKEIKKQLKGNYLPGVNRINVPPNLRDFLFFGTTFPNTTFSIELHEPTVILGRPESTVAIVGIPIKIYDSCHGIDLTEIVSGVCTTLKTLKTAIYDQVPSGQ